VSVFDLAYLLEQIVKASWKQTSLIIFIIPNRLNLALNGVSFPRSGLPIGKNRAVVALNTLINNRFSNL
jgi:hypothetical protein